MGREHGQVRDLGGVWKGLNDLTLHEVKKKKNCHDPGTVENCPKSLSYDILTWMDVDAIDMVEQL